MSAGIHVEIDDQGNVVADFVAFQGRSCEQAESRLKEALARWGVQVKAKTYPKPDEVIQQELIQSRKRTKPLCKTAKL